MDKKIVLSVLDAIRGRFSKTQEFIGSTLKKKNVKKKVSAEEVIFCKFKSKKLVWIIIFCFKFDTKVFIFLFIDVERCDR